MAILKCKMCGGDLTIQDGMTVAECEYCGTKQTVPTADNEKKMTLFARANRLRAACEFDKAAGIYENIIADFPEEAEAYWGLVLCKFGIEYVDDPATGKKIPTCHRSSFDSIMDDDDFEQVMENADFIARRVYREEAKAIEEIRKGIIEVSSKEEPYDIFICYKETDENGERTIDSVIAQDIYDMLTENNYRVFFARISLEDKLGTAYEPYIFAALNSARIMLAVGTDYDFYNAVWVKNEWSRFLMLMAKDKKKVLIPCYKNLDAYDIPKEFKHLQAQDMGKIGAMQDLLRGVKKIMPKEKEQIQAVKVTEFSDTSENAKIQALLKRVFIFLEDGDWESANHYCEKVLDNDPENAEAYLGKLMAKYRVSKRESLKQLPRPFDDDNDYKKAIRFGGDDLKYELSSYNEYINKREAYNTYIELLNKSHNPEQLLQTKLAFDKLKFKDSDDKAKLCQEVFQKESAIITADNKRAQELELQFSAYKNLEADYKKWQEASESIVYDINEPVGAEKEYAAVKNEMDALSSQLRGLGAFKKKEKEAISSRIVALGKQMSQISRKIEEQKEHRLKSYQEEKRRHYDAICDTEKELRDTRRAWYLEAGELVEKKMFNSAIAIYQFLGDYVDCKNKYIETEQLMNTYRNEVEI